VISELSFCRYRLELVERWPDSDVKAATLEGIYSRIKAIHAELDVAGQQKALLDECVFAAAKVTVSEDRPIWKSSDAFQCAGKVSTEIDPASKNRASSRWGGDAPRNPLLNGFQTRPLY
jgi:hypothetical protein